MSPVEELAHLTQKLNAIAEALVVALETGSATEIETLLEQREPFIVRLRQIGMANCDLVLNDPAVRAMAARELELLQQAKRRRSEIGHALNDVRRKSSLDREYGLA